MRDFQSKPKKNLESIYSHGKEELALLHSARATPALVENIFVSAYGQKMPLNQIASLSTPDARTILIQPWDAALLPAIQKAVETSGLGMGMSAEEKFIRLTMPQLSEERKREIAKLLGKKAEETRVAMRKERESAMRIIEDAFKNKEISEDEKFRARETLQKLIDEYIERVDDLEEKKLLDINTQ